MKLDLTRSETAVLKGMAIGGILLHNYCHWFSFTVKENEFTYHRKWPYYLWEHVKHLDEHLFYDLLSYFGHYGVPVFVFLSGYGLVCKYGADAGTLPSVSRFARYNVCKLWRLMLPALLLFLASDALLHDGHLRVGLWTLLGEVTFTANLFPDPGGRIHPGPYWYFGLTMQLYLCYRLALWRAGRAALLLTAAGSLLLQGVLLAMGPRADAMLEYVRYNCVGALLPFCMGLYAARYPVPLPRSRAGWASMGGLLCLLTVGAAHFRGTWLLAPLPCVGAAVCCARSLPESVSRVWAWLGGLSAFVFVLHPLWRPWWLMWGGADGLLFGLTGYVACVLLSARFYAALSTRIPAPRL